MCIIITKKQGIELPNKNTLKNCEENNPHGCGIALWKQGRKEVYIKKDFKNYKKLYNFLIDNVKKEDVLIIHFRIATDGLIDKGNRHPFPLTKNIKLLRKINLLCNYAVAHNGILNRWSGHEKYSDTQKFIFNVLSEPLIKNNLQNKTIQELITGYLGKDKLAILTCEGNLYLFGDWIEENNGLLFSNDGYQREKILLYNYDYKKYLGYKNNKKYNNKCEFCSNEAIIKYKEIWLCKKCYWLFEDY